MQGTIRFRALVALTALTALAALPAVHAQHHGLSYTTAQAERGKQTYQAHCAHCHGGNLDDGPMGWPLKGPEFMRTYGGGSVRALFDVTRQTMPTENPGALDATAYADLVAYMLQANDIVPGADDLPADARLLDAMLVPEGGFSFMAYSPYTPRTLVELPNPLDDFRSVDDAALSDPPAADWLGWRRSYDAHGFSPLDEIDAGNAGALRLAWSWSLPAGSAENVPIVRDGTLFMQSHGDVVQALDARTGELIWQYTPALEPGASPFHKRGITLYGDRLYAATSDTRVLALDVYSGELVWERKIGEFREREVINGGPLVARDRVLIGTTATGVGAKPGGPKLVGLDAGTGEIRWQLGTIAGPGEPGGDSWNGVPFEERTGASVWTPPSYDPQTGLVYFGTGNTYDTGPLLAPDDTPGVTSDALYTNTTMAVAPETGELIWHFQHFPNDQWDLDWAFERHVVDLEIEGRTRRAVLTAGKIGIYDALDAATGEFLFSWDLGLQNIVTDIDPVSGAKMVDTSLYPSPGEMHVICPHGAGAKNYLPASLDAAGRELYVPLNEACMDVYPVPGGGTTAALSSGVNWGIRPRPDDDGKYGRLQALDLNTGEPSWTVRQRAPLTSGVLATAGNVLFVGSLDRYFRAHDARDGATLWEVRLNDVSSSSPIAYAVDGKQYIAVVVGMGGFHARSFAPLVPELRSPPNRGATIWAFTLPDPRR